MGAWAYAPSVSPELTKDKVRPSFQRTPLPPYPSLGVLKNAREEGVDAGCVATRLFPVRMHQRREDDER